MVESKIKVELNNEIENEYYKVQVKELELDGRYLFIRGIALDIDKKEASEFEDSLDLSDFCWNEACGEQEITEQETIEQDTETSAEAKN